MLERKRESEAGSVVVDGDGAATVQTRLESEEGEACGGGGTDAGNMQVKAVLLPVTALLSGPAVAVVAAAVVAAAAVGAVVTVVAREDAGADGTSSIAFSGKSAPQERKKVRIKKGTWKAKVDPERQSSDPNMKVRKENSE